MLAAAGVRAAVAASLGVSLRIGGSADAPAAAAAAVAAPDDGVAAAAEAARCSAAVDSALEEAMRAAEAAGTRRAAAADDDCAICFDALGAALSLLTFCGACKGTVHAACMKQWAVAKRAKGEAVSCPCCRWGERRGGGGGLVLLLLLLRPLLPPLPSPPITAAGPPGPTPPLQSSNRRSLPRRRHRPGPPRCCRCASVPPGSVQGLSRQRPLPPHCLHRRQFVRPRPRPLRLAARGAAQRAT